MLLPEHVREVYAKATCICTKDQVEAAFDKMAQEMSAVAADKNPVLLAVLKGGMVTVGNLMPRLDFPLEIDYVHASRYGDEFSGSSKLDWKAEPRTDLKDRVVIIVDDILDEGLTLSAIHDYCKAKGAKEILTAALVDKKKTRAAGGLADVDFKGMIIEDIFIFGYGLDYKEYLRNAPGIYAVAEEHK